MLLLRPYVKKLKAALGRLMDFLSDLGFLPLQLNWLCKDRSDQGESPDNTQAERLHVSRGPREARTHSELSRVSAGQNLTMQKPKFRRQQLSDVNLR